MMGLSEIARRALPTAATAVLVFEYDPAEITAAAGGDITYINEDGTAHTATSSDGAFDSGSLQDGDTGTITAPDELGEYPHMCIFHPFMKGTLVVR